MNNFRHANESLSKQIEILKKNRLAIIEELMYHRSLNTCLRFESQNFLNSSQESHGNYKTPTPIPHHNSYSKSSSTSSRDSSTTIDSSSSSQESIRKKYLLVHNIRISGRCKGNSRFGVSSSERSSPVKAGRLIRSWLSMSDVPLQRNIEDDRKIKRVWVRSIGEVDDNKNTAMKSSSGDSIMGERVEL